MRQLSLRFTVQRQTARTPLHTAIPPTTTAAPACLHAPRCTHAPYYPGCLRAPRLPHTATHHMSLYGAAHLPSRACRLPQRTHGACPHLSSQAGQQYGAGGGTVFWATTPRLSLDLSAPFHICRHTGLGQGGIAGRAALQPHPLTAFHFLARLAIRVPVPTARTWLPPQTLKSNNALPAFSLKEEASQPLLTRTMASLCLRGRKTQTMFAGGKGRRLPRKTPASRLPSSYFRRAWHAVTRRTKLATRHAWRVTLRLRLRIRYIPARERRRTPRRV